MAKHLTSLVGGFLLFLAGRKVNKNGAKKRLLVVFGGGIGDVAIGSIACGYLKEYLKEYDAYYLTSYKFKLPYAKEHILFNYHKAKKDPFYYFQLVNRLRNIGFSEVVVIFPFLGRIFGISGKRRKIGTGILLQRSGAERILPHHEQNKLFSEIFFAEKEAGAHHGCVRLG